MRIAYSKKHINITLYSAIFLALPIVIAIVSGEQFSGNIISWCLFSLISFSVYFYQRYFKYVTIENGFINENGPFGKKLALDKIKQIREFAGDYILSTDDKSMTINTQIVAKDSLPLLKNSLQQLNVDWK
ncbi:hypothetical protein [Fulvivirga ligni]|uniref:hypothetical protein n=1 Tax=Fulvivirga ligni TaxID=2904246 RepID=UPI001F21A74F|nr:hypothetical protein [Fulvivirga ligni]UII20925.1 hypothetical protein LVD16_24075 [Fulvivirga ligni]